jgi:Domain of unknown function (DUF892)
MEGLIEEGSEMIEEDAEARSARCGAYRCGAARRTLRDCRVWLRPICAESLGDTKGAELLQRTLDEEGATDTKLTELAKTLINTLGAERKNSWGGSTVDVPSRHFLQS